MKKKIKQYSTRETSSKIRFFENIYKIDKLWLRLKKREKTKITKLKNERWNITTKHTGKKKNFKKCCEQFYINKLDSIGDINKFLEKLNS